MAAYPIYYENEPTEWCESLMDSEGHHVLGRGLTPEQAEQEAANNLAAQEAVIAMPPEGRLRHILETQPHFFGNDVRGKAIRLLAQIVLGDQ